MPIAFPIALPAVGIRSARFLMRSVVGLARSPFTGEQQAQGHAGQWWEADIVYPPMVRAEAEGVIAFLAKLNGREGTFLMGDPDGKTPRGAAAQAPGTPLVKGAGQSGTTLVIDGAPAGTSGYLRAGDYISLGSGLTTRLYKALEDADSDGSGTVTLTLWPSLRASPADNAPVVVSNTLGLWRLASDERAWEADAARVYGIGFTALEAL